MLWLKLIFMLHMREPYFLNASMTSVNTKHLQSPSSVQELLALSPSLFFCHSENESPHCDSLFSEITLLLSERHIFPNIVG